MEDILEKVRARDISKIEFDAEFIALCEGRVKWVELPTEVKLKLRSLNRVTSEGKPDYHRLLPERFPWILPPGSPLLSSSK